MGPTILASYPSVRRDESVVEDHFGMKIADPYRWLEDPDSEETAAFVKAQNQVTESYLNKCTLKDTFRNRLKTVWNYERFSCPFKFGNFYYYWRNSGLQNQSVLYQLADLSATPSVFLDPNQIDADGLASVRAYSFSEEGEYFAYGLSHGGSDWYEIKFKRTDTGEHLPDVLKHVKFSGIEWTHDGLGAFYAMYLDHQGKADGTETTSNRNQKLMYHRLGTPQSEDILCVEFPDHPDYMIGADVSTCGRYIYISVQEGCEPNNLLYYADLQELDDLPIQRPFPIKPIIDHFEAVYEYVTNEGPIVYLRTNMDAPMYRLIAMDLSNPSKAAWKEIVPHDHAILFESAVCIHQDFLIVNRLKDVKSYLSVVKLKTGEKVTDIDLPLGSVTSIQGRKRDHLAFVRFESFLTPGQIFSCDFTQQPLQLELFRDSRPNEVDLSAYKAEQVFYRSKDGTQIPMFIVRPSDMILDGTRPCQLYGYGGFEISITPSFNIKQIVWMLNFGGIVAIANIRGGGEYGKSWHDAGRRKFKQNCFDDFQAAAEYLIKEGYTNRDKLFLSGGSNGGLLVCVCANQRPDLFGAVVAHVPVCDVLRFHKFTIGHAWISDFGDPDKKEDFDAIIRYSPLHNIRPPSGNSTSQYPAIMILTADHDDRVVPLHSFKFIATLQSVLSATNSTRPLLARIDTKAGHGAGKPTSKSIEEIVDVFAFLQLALSLTWTD